MSRSTAAPRIPEEHRDEYRALSEHPRSAIVRADFLAVFRRLELLRSADPGWRPPRGAADPGSLGPGRGPIHRLSVRAAEGDGPDAGPAVDIVVRPYRRGGLVRHLVEARYLLGDRAFHELILLARLRRRGLPVPSPLAAVQRRRWPGYRATLVTRLVPGVRPLSRLLPGAGPADARTLMEGAGATVGRLHAAGAHHADLNAHNLLADPEDSGRPVYVVDWDRGRLEEGPLAEGAARRNLRRLRRSLEKLSLETGLSYWDTLVREYRRNRAGTAGGSAG